MIHANTSAVLSTMTAQKKGKYKHTSFYCTLLYCALQILHFSQIEGLCIPCIKQVYCNHFPNSISSLHVSRHSSQPCGLYPPQTPLSLGFSRQDYWSGLPCPPLGDLPKPGIEPASLSLLHWQTGSLPLASPEKPLNWSHRRHLSICFK